MEKPMITIPADVPRAQHEEYIKNYIAITRSTGRLMLFACDQKLEHLNRDFYGPAIDPADNNPEHLFQIASQGDIGAFATHLGLIAQYGPSYKNVHYIVKMNGKTDLVKTTQKDPLSLQLWSLKNVISLKQNSGLSICGIGYTIYPGSEYESYMLREAAELLFQAHEHGLVTILWVYPRGKAVVRECAPDIIAGAAGLGASLGADFVKLNQPEASPELSPYQALNIAVQAAGRTKVIMSGGAAQDPRHFLQELYEQLHVGGSAGSATGRNIHQRSLSHAIAMTRAISSLVFLQSSVDDALKRYT